MRGMSSIAKAVTPRRPISATASVVAVRVHDGDDRRAGLGAFDLAAGRALDPEHDVGARERRVRIGRDGRAGGLIIGICNARLHPGPGLHRYVGAEPDVFLDRLGRRGDTGLGRVGLGRDGDTHQSLRETSANRRAARAGLGIKASGRQG